MAEPPKWVTGSFKLGRHKMSEMPVSQKGQKICSQVRARHVVAAQPRTAAGCKRIGLPQARQDHDAGTPAPQMAQAKELAGRSLKATSTWPVISDPADRGC